MRFLESFLLSIIAIFAPLKAVVITTLVMVVADLITGVLAARKQGIPITSSGIKTTVAKLFLYEVALLLSYLCEVYLLGGFIPASKLVSALIGITELKSVLENFNILHGSNLFSALVQKLINSEKDKLE